MTVKKFELFVNHNNTSGVVQVVQEDASGRLVDPISLIVNEAFVMAFASLFSAAQQAAVTTLTAEKATAITARDVAISEKETAQSKVATLTTEIAALQAQANVIPALQAKIAQLLTEVSYNPRAINAGAFARRLNRDQLVRIYSSSSSTQLKIYIANEQTEPILLDSNTFVAWIASLVATKQITPDEAVELTRDASRDEAFVVS